MAEMKIINPKTGKVDKKKTKALEIENMLYDSSKDKSNYMLEAEAESKGDVGRRARSILKARKLKKKLRGMGIALRGGGIVSRS